MTEAALLSDIVTRIRTVLEPDRIVLFGSRARDAATDQSDIDILVIAPSNAPRWRRVVPLLKALSGLGTPKDVVWWTPDEIHEWDGVSEHFIQRAVHDGRTLYERAA